MRGYRTITALAAALALGAALPVAAWAQPRAVATVGMLADVAQNVAGDCVAVETMMGPGTDPHLYKASAGDVQLLFGADAILYAGNNLEGQLGVLQEDIGQLFREELLPGITSEAVRGGQLGGGRQGVAQGMAADAAAEAYTKGAVELRSRDQAQRDAIAAGIADRNIQGAQVGLAGSPGLLQIASGGIDAQTAPMQFLASILGDPTVLTQAENQSQGQSFSNAWDFARAFAESFGSSQSTDQSRSNSSSRTSSTSTSKSMGIGF